MDKRRCLRYPVTSSDTICTEHYELSLIATSNLPLLPGPLIPHILIDTSEDLIGSTPLSLSLNETFLYVTQVLSNREIRVIVIQAFIVQCSYSL